MALTRSQIKARIDKLNRQKNNYEYDRTKYRNSLNYANKLLSSLKNSNDYLNSSNDYLKKFFTINGKTGDNGEINKNKDKINKIIKDLNNVIIPEINNNIIELNNRINSTSREISSLKRDLEKAEI